MFCATLKGFIKERPKIIDTKNGKRFAVAKVEYRNNDKPFFVKASFFKEMVTVAQNIGEDCEVTIIGTPYVDKYTNPQGREISCQGIYANKVEIVSDQDKVQNMPNQPQFAPTHTPDADLPF